MKKKLCSFRYGRIKPKADNTNAEKIALARLRSLVQFFLHVIDNSFYRLSPLDSPLASQASRLATALPVMIDNLLTAIADGQPSDAKAAFMRRYNKFPLARRLKGGIALVGSYTATELKNEKVKRFL